MTTTFPKEYKSPTDLVQLLKTRGLTIADEQKAESYLINVDCTTFRAEHSCIQVVDDYHNAYPQRLLPSFESLEQGKHNSNADHAQCKTSMDKPWCKYLANIL